jgi:hypothetical protein
VLRAADLIPIRYGIDRAPRASGSRSGRWFSESSAVGLLRVADCVAVLVAGLLAYTTRFPDEDYIVIAQLDRWKADLDAWRR